MDKERKDKSINPEPEPVRAWLREIEQTWSTIPEFPGLPQSNFQHLAVICDGNRRAAKQKGLNAVWGHRAGVEVIKGIMKAGKEWGINTLTFWVWSTGNWKRDSGQVGFIMDLATKFINEKDFVRTFLENQTRFVHLGRKDRLPHELIRAIGSLEERTAGFDQMTVNLAMDHGGVDEVSRAVIRIVQQTEAGRFNLDDLINDPQIILGFLDTGNQPNPNLVIRTGVTPNEIPHTSGFMPLQTVNSGWDFEESLFPNYTPEQMMASIKQFTGYERRLGK